MDKVFTKKNPIIRGKGICDPHMHVFNDRVYLYATHDYSVDNKGYVMKDWQIWSSADLIEWTHKSIFRPEDTYIGPSDRCWATDAAERNGKYYFYFSNGTDNTGVAVSDNPGGPFKDALGRPMLDGSNSPTKEYDPAIFIDDDENATPYIIFGTPKWAGGDSYYIARLNEDMVSLAEKPRKVIVDDPADDKPSLNKYKGKYYLTWASFYAISDTVYGPYKLIGNHGASPDHGSYFEWKNQWFNAFTILDPTLHHRASGLCYVHFRENGEMVTDQLIVEYGVGQYNAEWDKIQAEWYMAAEGNEKGENPRRGFDIIKITDGSYLYYPNIHNIKENTGIHFYAACGNNTGGMIEIRADAPNGKLLGTCQVTPTGSWNWWGYRSFTCNLNNTSGCKNLYLVFRGEGDDILHLDWFSFF